MWTESSSVNAVNLVKNLLQFRDIEYFLNDYIIGAPCIWSGYGLHQHHRRTDGQTDGRHTIAYPRSTEHRAVKSSIQSN